MSIQVTPQYRISKPSFGSSNDDTKLSVATGATAMSLAFLTGSLASSPNTDMFVNTKNHNKPHQKSSVGIIANSLEEVLNQFRANEICNSIKKAGAKDIFINAVKAKFGLKENDFKALKAGRAVLV